MNLIDQIKEGLAINPAAPAFISNNNYMTHGQFYSLMSLVTKRLFEEGIQEGDVIGISMDQSPLHCAAILGVAALGAISIPLTPQSILKQKVQLLKNYDARAVICGPKIQSIPEFKNIRLTNLSFKEGEHTLDFLEKMPAPNMPARIALTSGTTGEPLGILYTHEYWIDRIEKTIDHIDQNSRVIPPDLHLTLGNIFALGALMRGACIIITRNTNFRDYVTDINIYAATHLIIPPMEAIHLVSMIKQDYITLPTVKHLRLVGAPLSGNLIKNVMKKLSPNLYFPYGISELGAISVATPEMLIKNLSTSGKIKPWVKVEAIDEEGKVVGLDQIGQLRVLVENMPHGYFKNDAVSTQRFKDGWFYTNDLGSVNADGEIIVEGRADDMINLDGEKFHPTKLESLLMNHENINDVALFAVKHDDLSSKMYAAFVSNKETIDQVFKTYPIAQKMIGNRTIITKKIPRNESGKILRKDLANYFEQEIQLLKESK